MIKKLLKRQVGLIRNRGEKYLCPFCGYRAKSLGPIGKREAVFKEKNIVGGRRNGGCWKCYSTDRDRLVYIFLKEKLKVFEQPNGMKVLHIAPEDNLFKVLFKANFDEYICGDLFTEGYENTYPEHVQDMNILEIPYDDQYFDLIICNHVLEHVPEDIAGMKELFRVLKLGGKAILQVPYSRTEKKTFEDFSITDPEQRKVIFGQFDHVRIYGKDYPKRLKTAGFEVEVFNISNEFEEYGLNELEDVFVGLK